MITKRKTILVLVHGLRQTKKASRFAAASSFYATVEVAQEAPPCLSGKKSKKDAIFRPHIYPTRYLEYLLNEYDLEVQLYFFNHK